MGDSARNTRDTRQAFGGGCRLKRRNGRLDGPEILRSSVDQGALGAPRPVGRTGRPTLGRFAPRPRAMSPKASLTPQRRFTTIQLWMNSA